jgi:serine/threonine protein kinase
MQKVEVWRYTIGEQIGEGNMGRVYKARDENLGIPVAIKILPRAVSTEVSRQRFKREAMAACQLEHPNICRVFDVGEVPSGQPFGGQLYISMAYYEGESLDEKITRGKLSLQDCLRYAIQVAEGLSEAHKNDIIHRDIKPANFIVTSPDGVIKIVDFGLAQSRGAERLSKPGDIVGTPAYMSPEQLNGKEVDHRTDIWSLGVVLFQAISGELPFNGDYYEQLRYKIIHEKPDSLTRLCPDVPESLRGIVEKAMTKNPDERYQDIQEMIHDLRSVESQSKGVSSEAKTREYARRDPYGKSALPSSSGAKTRAYSPTISLNHRIAVLLFEDDSPHPQEAHLAQSMTEELITKLSKIRRLMVRPLHSVLHYKETHKDIRDVGQELDVGVILEGRVRKTGGRLAIFVELINVQSEAILWSNHFHAENSQDAIIASIVEGVAGVLRLRLHTKEKSQIEKKDTSNLEAQELYQKGRYHWSLRKSEDLEKSISYFEQAIDKDPSYALAYAGLADCYILMGGMGENPAESFPKAREAAEKALALDDTLAEAHTSLAYVKLWHDWDWLGAEAEFKFALKKNPKYATAHQWYSEYLVAMRRSAEAIKEIRLALELAPKSFIIEWHAGRIYYLLHNYDRALKHFQKALEIDPAFSQAYRWLGHTYMQKEMHDEAMAAYLQARRLAGNPPEIVETLEEAYQAGGMKGYKRCLLEHLKKRSKERYIPPYILALVYVYLGETDQAFEWLEKAYDNKCGWLVLMQVDPRLQSLRNDKRFISLLRRVNHGVRVANAQGFWGDWLEAPLKQVAGDPIDYLTLDYLAEITMSILQKHKKRELEQLKKEGKEGQPLKTGYATDFVTLMETEGFLKRCVERNIKIVTNAGGLNPLACAKAVAEVAMKNDLPDLKIGIVTGDDITERFSEFRDTGDKLKSMGDGKPLSTISSKAIESANVYFGAAPILELLRRGTQIIITGRCTDTGLTLAPLMYELGWSDKDMNKLASGVVAGHIIECGATSTGGNCQLDWESIPDLANVGYPIIEAFENGSFIVTKSGDTGGRVTVETIKEQLLYELGDPHNFITPECVADFTTIQLEQVGDNRVKVYGIDKTKGPTPTYKVSVCYSAGFKAVDMITYSWPDAYKKAKKADEVIRKRLERIGLKFDEILSEFIGANALHGRKLAPEPSADLPEVALRIGVRGKDREAVERFCKELPPMILNGPPTGIGFSGGRPRVQNIVAYISALIEKPLIEPYEEVRTAESWTKDKTANVKSAALVDQAHSAYSATKSIYKMNSSASGNQESR